MKEFSVCIGNYGYYAEGEQHDAWLDLPATNAEMAEFMKTHKLQDKEYEEIYISDYDMPTMFNCENLFTEYTSLTMLNALAEQLAECCDDLTTVEHYAEYQYLNSICELMNVIEQREDIPFYGYIDPSDNWSDEANYGYTVAYETGLVDKLQELHIEGCFSYERYGEQMSQGAQLFQDGYIDACADGPDLNYYDRDELLAMYGQDEANEN